MAGKHLRVVVWAVLSVGLMASGAIAAPTNVALGASVTLNGGSFFTGGWGSGATVSESTVVDGVFLPHPAPSIIEMKGKGKVVVHSGEMWPNHACCSLVVTDKLIQEQPELVKAIIKVHIKATDYINAHPKEAAEIYAKKTKSNLTEIEHSVQNWDGKWVSDPNLQVSSTVDYAKVDFEMKYTSRELQEEDLFDTSLYEKVKDAE